MARKKPPVPAETAKVQRSTTATSLRLTPRCHDAIDHVADAFEMSKAAVVEAGVHLLMKTLDTARPRSATAEIESAKKSRPTP